MAVGDAHRAVAGALLNGSRRAVILGTLAQRHPDYAEIKSLAGALAELAGASVGCITEGANGAGAYLAGAVPHREPGGASIRAAGLSARAMLETQLKAYVLLGAIDPAADLSVGARALGGAEFVIAATTHLPESLRAVAHVVLPIGSFAEGSGTYVNAEGRWQSWSGAARPVGESRPGWKVLRVLANLLDVHGVDYDSSDEIRDAVKALCGDRTQATRNGVTGDAGVRADAAAGGADGGPPRGGAASVSGADSGAEGWVDIPPYQTDTLVRGSEALSKTKDGRMTRTVL
jgi:NADH-quinone oxidoreductase subunit G